MPDRAIALLKLLRLGQLDMLGIRVFMGGDVSLLPAAIKHLRASRMVKSIRVKRGDNPVYAASKKGMAWID